MKGADRQSSERCEIRERERREVGREKERRLDGRAEGIDMKCLDVVDDEMHSPNVAVRSVLSDRKERKKKSCAYRCQCQERLVRHVTAKTLAVNLQMNEPKE